MAEDGERWSCEAAEVTDLDAHRHSGFVVVARGPSGLIVSPQTPVQVPPEVSWRTLGRVTNAVGGWDRVLKPFGTIVHW